MSQLSELQNNITIDEQSPQTEPLEIKEESDVQIKLELENTIETNIQDENPFQNIQLHVKEELCDDQKEVTEDEKLIDAPFCEKEESQEEIKEECSPEDESLITYDYPNFEDSMDSSDATALGNVEACLQEDIKEENDIFQHGDKEVITDKIKEESDLSVTETNLISNKVINTSSTMSNPDVGVIESQTTKTLVMEIHPMIHSGSVALDKLGNPEEILSTSYEEDHDMDYSETFQLNSITGNVLSLEQEAYGLLKAKTQKILTNDRPHACPKCSKTYKSQYCLKNHLKVHTTIENYQNGIIKRLKTFEKNKLKRNDDDYDDDEIYKKTIRLTDIQSIKARQERFNKRNNVCQEESNVVIETKKETKKEGYECTCGQVFQRRSRMETCFRSHDLDNNSSSCYSCMSCSKQFKNKDELTSHRKRMHRKRFPCKFCPTDYHTRKELFKHLRIHQKVQLMEYKVIAEVMEGKQKLRCFMCDKSCTELSELKSHVMDDHKEPYVCPRCNETFSKIIDFGHHTKTDHPEVEGQSVLDVLEAFSKLVKAWKCEECELQFHEADKLAKHQVESHSPDLRTETQYQCDDCRRVFVSQKGLTSHRRIHHSTGSTEEAETVEGVMCIECRKICKDEAALTSHMRLHSPDRKYPCKFCDFRFATPEKRKAHTELHTGDMKYVCFICEYQCTSENRLKQHKMSEKHLNMKQYLLLGQTQEQSVKTTDDLAKVESQTSSSTTEDDAIICDICGEKFSNSKKMLKHKETHPFIVFPNEDTPTRIFFK
ncbi:zinc finger protein 260-like [Colias croceus]|uniref:zinc finger protein 260-like n=1 Tax=Colias crocea TaxID=72248 RepID=UPI001E27D43B|nr:zinc finger protein 260-like [Colias croceus]